jgi:4-diphosphocytidyl-2-C-methyl-D-erythritol kinase
MSTLRTLAPAKVNLCLYVGPARPGDGRHELVTVMDSLDLADDVTLTSTPGADADEVRCPGVDGPNLAAAALHAFREHTGWDGPPVLVEIAKRIPVAGGMAGGSADAAAALRLAASAAGIEDAGLLEAIGTPLGADVPSQVRGGPVLATGAGERLAPLARPRAYTVLVAPLDAALTAGAVFAEADRLGAPRDADGLHACHEAVRAAGGDVLCAGLVVNDLQDAARSLCAPVGIALAEMRDAGADHVLVSGSGPTTLGLFHGDGHEARAAAACAALAHRRPAPVLARPAAPGAFAVTGT